MKKRIIINLIYDADEDFPALRDNELISDDIISELSCCWHHYEVQDIEIKTDAEDENHMSKEIEVLNIKDKVNQYLREEYFPSDEFRQLVKETVLGSSKQPAVEGASNVDEHYTRINHLLEALQEARIYAGAEFEACCNEMDHGSAVYFSGFRDILATYIRSLEDYLTILTKEEESRCPVCGKKTSMGKNGGKICFDCVNRKRN